MQHRSRRRDRGHLLERDGRDGVDDDPHRIARRHLGDDGGGKFSGRRIMF